MKHIAILRLYLSLQVNKLANLIYKVTPADIEQLDEYTGKKDEIRDMLSDMILGVVEKLESEVYASDRSDNSLKGIFNLVKNDINKHSNKASNSAIK